MKQKEKRKKLFLTKEEIIADSEKANELAKQGLIKEREIPEYWVKGISDLDKKTNLLLAIFLGMFGIDRFYLKKYISGITKLFLIAVVTPTSLYLCIEVAPTNKNYLDVIIVFSILFNLASLSFFIGDIVIGIIKPRDYFFKELKFKNNKGVVNEKV